MRLVLDYCKTTNEAIELLGQYNLDFAGPGCHLMIADAEGDSAVVEFIDGFTRVTRTEPTWQVCTNSQISSQTKRNAISGVIDIDPRRHSWRGLAMREIPQTS